MRTWIRTLGVILLAIFTNTYTNAENFYGPNELNEIVTKAYKADDFVALDKLATKLRTERSRTPSGVWNLTVFYGNLGYAIVGEKEKNSEAQWAAIESKLNRWVAAFPQSAMAPIALATAQKQHAWALRGSGYASTVTPEGWNGFASYMAIARNTLDVNKKISSDDPQWYIVMLDVALAQNWTRDQHWALYEEAVSKEPLHYQTYFVAAERFLPMWGGSMRQIQDFAADAVRRTTSTEGQGMYARIYWVAAGRMGGEAFFAESHRSAVWSQMKAGFEDVLKKYPADWNRNAYAKFACQAGDVDTFIAMTRSFNGTPMKDAWPGDYFQKCKEYAGKLRPNSLL